MPIHTLRHRASTLASIFPGRRRGSDTSESSSNGGLPPSLISASGSASSSTTSLHSEANPNSEYRSTICSLYSGSYNDTASDLPGPGRLVGRVYSRLGRSIEHIWYARKTRKGHVGRRASGEAGGPIVAQETDNIDLQDECIEEELFPDTESVFIDEDVEDCDSLHSSIASESAPAPSSSLCNSPRSSEGSLSVCSLARSLSINETRTGLPGAGRTLGIAYARAGRVLERALARLAVRHHPRVVAKRARRELRHITHANFLMRYRDLERKQKSVLMSKCERLLVQATKSTTYLMQMAALMRILELAISFPLARDCFRKLGALDTLQKAGTDVFARSDHRTFSGVGSNNEATKALDHEKQDLETIEAAQSLDLLQKRCIVALEENEAYALWRRFFLAGDDFEREKCISQLLTLLSGQYHTQCRSIGFITARVLTSILRRADRLADDTWADILQTITGILREANEDSNGRQRDAIDPPAMDSLICSALSHSPRLDPSSSNGSAQPEDLGYTDKLLRQLLREFSQIEHVELLYPSSYTIVVEVIAIRCIARIHQE